MKINIIFFLRQAAIGSQALDYARKTNAGPEAETLGEQVRDCWFTKILGMYAICQGY